MSNCHNRKVQLLMSPKSANSSSKESLKQGTLSFATVKRVGSSNATSKSKSLIPTKPAPKPRTSTSSAGIEDDFDDVELFFSEDDEDEIQEPTYEEKPGTRAQTRAADKLTTAKKSPQGQKATAVATINLGTIPSKPSKARPDDVPKIPGISTDEKPELNIKDRKWNKHYAEVREKRGHLSPGELWILLCLRQTLIIISKKKVHAGNQNRIHEILRVFDL